MVAISGSYNGVRKIKGQPSKVENKSDNNVLFDEGSIGTLNLCVKTKALESIFKNKGITLPLFSPTIELWFFLC